MANETREQVHGDILRYKDKPLVREGETICYGDMSEKCILILEIMSYKTVGDNKVPDSVFIQIIDSKDPSKIYKQGQKQGLYDAFSLGTVWLDQELKNG